MIMSLLVLINVDNDIPTDSEAAWAKEQARKNETTYDAQPMNSLVGNNWSIPVVAIIYTAVNIVTVVS